MPTVEPFTLHTDPASLEDLRRRLRATRWPDAIDDAGWSLGTDVEYLRELVDYWADGFDWRARRPRSAEFHSSACPGYHRRRLGDPFRPCPGGDRPGPLPLVLTHGWPDSFWRYAKVIPLLTDPGAHGADPADAFDVVVPDLPGYGYSERPTDRAHLDRTSPPSGPSS